MRWLTTLLMIRDDERSHAIYYMALFVLIGMGLSIGHGTTATLFLKRYGVEFLPVMYLMLGVSMALVSLTYAAYVDRISAEKLFVWMLAALAAAIVAAWSFMTFEATEWVYPAYYLIYELAYELLILHAKLYLDQNFDSMQLQRLSSPILASAIVGKAAGGLILGLLAPYVGVAGMLPVWTMLIAATGLLVVWHHRRAGVSPYYHPTRKRPARLRHAVEQVTQGLKFFRKTKMLRAVSCALFFMTITMLVLEYAIDSVLTETFATEALLASFLGWVTAIMGTIALLVQLLLTSRLLGRFGVTRVGLVPPVFAVTSFLALFVSFSLPAALVGIFSRDVVFIAIRKPTRMLFMHALPGYMMGRVSALSAALVLPLALLVAGVFILLAQTWDGTNYLVIGGVLSSLLYLHFRIRANREYSQTLLTNLTHHVFLPQHHHEEMLHGGNEELRTELLRGVADPDDNVALAYARTLVGVFPEAASEAIARRLPTAGNTTRDCLLRLLISRKLPIGNVLHAALADADPHLEATILDALFDARDGRAAGRVADCLQSDNPRLAATGIFGVSRYELSGFEPLAREIWDRLLAGSRDGEQIAGLELLTRLPDERMRPHLVRLMRSPSDRVRRAALRALAGFPSGALNELAPALTELYESDDPEIRALCVAGSRVLDSESCRELCLRALEDPHPGARDQALVLLEQVEGRSQAVEIVCRWVLENRGFPRAQQSALSALSRYRLPREVFERIAESKVSEACMLARATRIIRQESGAKTGGDPVMELLGVVMQERVRQIVDLALMAMENFEDRKAIAAIRAGVASRDRRHVAHACEALHTMCCHRLAGPLVALVDNTGYAKHETDDKQEHAFQNSRDVIGWCIRHPDAWLRECAARAVPAPRAGEMPHG